MVITIQIDDLSKIISLFLGRLLVKHRNRATLIKTQILSKLTRKCKITVKPTIKVTSSNQKPVLSGHFVHVLVLL